MAAFRGAVEAGAHAIETDLHLSKDGVVVLAHVPSPPLLPLSTHNIDIPPQDPSLKRTFGINKKVADCDWAYLSTLRTPRPPHEPLARLSDLLKYIAQPALSSIWLLLDIKLTDDPTTLLTAIAATLSSTPALPSHPWHQRVLLGCWTSEYTTLAAHLLPSYPLSHIGFSHLHATPFLANPSVTAYNIMYLALVGPLGRRFVRAIGERSPSAAVFAWTVNGEYWMRWCVSTGRVDGVVTDDPKAMGEVCRRWGAGERGGEGGGEEGGGGGGGAGGDDGFGGGVLGEVEGGRRGRRGV
ncbi:PLC-like phosphodiesterase [Schizothecium vesticola]|uniref:PLC-like phosphodiesterase n=1 Tax=Schizothecium vesticola TaxID=314040 RepID=A0AA40F872_9PEZI|nr:PLC-like phosphodiesterase [Schizothecium vesticola]